MGLGGEPHGGLGTALRGVGLSESLRRTRGSPEFWNLLMDSKLLSSSSRVRAAAYLRAGGGRCPCGKNEEAPSVLKGR